MNFYFAQRLQNFFYKSNINLTVFDLKSEQEASEYQNEGEKRKKRKTRELVGSTEN